MMFKQIFLRFRDMKTLGKLIPAAEEQANLMGEEKPGAEHFVLSALSLEDGTAKRALDRFGIDSQKFKNAIKEQYDEALRAIGIIGKVSETDPEPIKSDKLIHESKPSAQDLIKALYQLKKEDKDRPLQSAHVLVVAASIEYGVVPRAFKVLGIDRDSLVQVAKEELISM